MRQTLLLCATGALSMQRTLTNLASSQDVHAAVPDPVAVLADHPLRCAHKNCWLRSTRLHPDQNGPTSVPTSADASFTAALLAGHDLIGIAATGSGKTLAFVRPLCALRHRF